MFHKLLDKAEAGDQVGLLLRGLKRSDIKRGQFVIQPKSFILNNYFECQVCYFWINLDFRIGREYYLQINVLLENVFICLKLCILM